VLVVRKLDVMCYVAFVGDMKRKYGYDVSG